MGDQHRGSPLEVAQADLTGGCQHLLAPGDLACQHGSDEHRGGLLRRQFGCAHPLDLRGDQRAHEAQEAGVRRPPRPHPQPADLDVGDAQLDRRDALGVAEQRTLVGRRARGDRQRLAAAIEHDHARVEHPRRGAHDGGQPRPGLHRRGDLVEGREVHCARARRVAIRSDPRSRSRRRLRAGRSPSSLRARRTRARRRRTARE